MTALPPRAVSLPRPVLEVVIAVRGGARTLSDVAEATGSPRGTARHRLERARALGLVDWEPTRHATITPLVRLLPPGAQ